jgi:hypothetical protein
LSLGDEKGYEYGLWAPIVMSIATPIAIFLVYSFQNHYNWYQESNELKKQMPFMDINNRKVQPLDIEINDVINDPIAQSNSSLQVEALSRVDPNDVHQDSSMPLWSYKTPSNC